MLTETLATVNEAIRKLDAYYLEKIRNIRNQFDNYKVQKERQTKILQEAIVKERQKNAQLEAQVVELRSRLGMTDITLNTSREATYILGLK